MPKITSKKELDFYLRADLMMSKGVFKKDLMTTLRDIVVPDYINRYLRAMRKYCYYESTGRGFFMMFWRYRYHNLGLKLGLSIGHNVFGYGLLIPHYGDIVVGANQIGNYAVLQPGACISGNGKKIGDALYMSAGAKITNQLVLGDNVSVAANSVVTKSFPQGNILLVGMPAIKKTETVPWYIRDGEDYKRRHDMIEDLKKRMNL